MAVTQTMLEMVAAWCNESLEFAPARKLARAAFFGEDDERPVDYWPGAEEHEGRERRFLGYFAFNHVLPSGERPAEVAIKRLYAGNPQAELLAAVDRARYVQAAVKAVVGRSVYLEVESEEFEVRAGQWARALTRGLAFAAHLVPARPGRITHWLLGPGWVVLPFKLGPGMRASLASLQSSPIEIERTLQGRAHRVGEPPPPKLPEDENLDAAVARLTAWAEEHGHEALVMPAKAWEALVLKHLDSAAITAFYREAMGRVGTFSSQEELGEVSGLLSNIWNNTPQPDRGGRTANQLIGRGRD